MTTTDQFGPVDRLRLSGDERFHRGDAPLDFNVLDFWRWSGSDLVSNATRGVIAEFIVANACGIPTNGVRDEWAASDLLLLDTPQGHSITPKGHSIEVKSAAYLQSWYQKSLSPITFSIKKARAWDPKANTFAEKASRSAKLYVFALLAHTEKKTLDPLNVDQWRAVDFKSTVRAASAPAQELPGRLENLPHGGSVTAWQFESGSAIVKRGGTRHDVQPNFESWRAVHAPGGHSVCRGRR